MKKFLYRSIKNQASFFPKTSLRAFSLLAIAILALSTLSSCMMWPVNQTPPLIVHDKTRPQTFTGALPVPSQKVTIWAYDPQTENWINIAETTSESFDWPEGTYRYNWYVHKVIDPQYWATGQECASTGESALVRASWALGDIASFEEMRDSLVCSDEHKSDQDFFDNCQSPESPNVRIPSLNYRDFGMECAQLINDIRKLEGKTTLQVDEAGECDADDDAKCNQEHGTHFCKNHGAQNECHDQYGSIDDVLEGCIWNDMYLTEKQCYIDDPQDCYHCDENPGCTSCECGHYVNMVISNPTEVSCGLYVFKNEWGKSRYKSVQNFR